MILFHPKFPDESIVYDESERINIVTVPIFLTYDLKYFRIIT